MPQPYCIDGNEIGDKKTTLDMGLLEGCPCVVCNYDSVYFDVWMMKEYGGLKNLGQSCFLFSSLHQWVISLF